MKRRLLFVLGMHRSGTSALTRVLNCLGAEVGDDLLPPLEGENALGFWEHRKLVAVDEALLSRLDRPWYDFRPLPAGWETGDEAGAVRAELRELLESMDWGSGLVVMKDPRLCRLFLLWRSVAEEAGIVPCAVLPTREPSEIAQSIGTRNGLDTPCSHALFAAYALDAERGSRGLSRCAVTFDALLEDWRTVVANMADALDLQWPRPLDEAADVIDGHLRPELRHERVAVGRSREEGELGRLAADLHETLARGDLTDHGAFDALRSRYESVLAAGEPFATTACRNLRHQVELSEELQRRALAAEERLGYYEDRVRRVKEHWSWPVLRKAARILRVGGFEE